MDCPTCTNTRLKNVTVTDDVVPGYLPIVVDANPPATSVTLNPGQCGNFAGSYYPDSVVGEGDPSDQQYSDTVTATGQEQIGNAPASDTATANCKLCPTCPNGTTSAP